MGLLSGRLVWLTIVKGEQYEKISQGNRIKVYFEPANRGVIFDTQGEILARNIPEGRKYLYGETMAHITGYTGLADSQDLANQPELSLPGAVGKAGLEKQYDRILRGKEAERLVETDTNGEIVRELGYKAGQDGQNLKLSVDRRVQQKAYAALGEKTGAVIVSRPNGQVLALVSKPSFDPNLFVTGQDSAEISDHEQANKIDLILNDTSQPLFNRAIAGLYPPGSTFKIVTATAGLESQAINGETVFLDTGKICFGQWCFTNWYYTQYGGTDGEVNLVKAIQRSNDIYFYQVGQLTGIRQLADWAKNYGLAAPTGIDLPGEEAGSFPSEEWKENTIGESWYLGDTIITSIGQGYTLVTPMQINQVTRIIAQDGLLCPPQILAAVQDESKSGDWTDYPPAKCRSLAIRQAHLDLIKQGMQKACETGGSAWPLFEFKVKTNSGEMTKIPLACKTGTAEFGDPEEKTHAWLTVFAPVVEPEIVITVLVEKGGQGSNVAAPVAKEVLTDYFENR